LTIGQEFAKKNEFSLSGHFEKPLDFRILETQGSGTLFAFIEFVLAQRIEG
jgi:hypothetical protein